MQKSIIAILLLSSSAVFAHETSDQILGLAPFKGELSRAEVKVALAQAQADGTSRYDEHNGYAQKAPQGTRTRAEVRAEAVDAVRAQTGREQHM